MPIKNTSKFLLLSTTCLAAFALPQAGRAQSAVQSLSPVTGQLSSQPGQFSAAAPSAISTESLSPTPTAWRFTYETWKLPESERMGMLGANLLFDVHENVKLGMASYGALTGQRGGFITLGFAGELQQRLSESWRVHTGVYAGAGGGSSGLSLVGGGFMFRADAGITYEMGPYGNIGAGVSYVNFPTGAIRSTQPYVMYEYPFNSLIGSGWDTGPVAASGKGSGLSTQSTARRQEFAVAALSYQIPSSVTKDTGAPEGSSMQLLGVEWLSYLDDRWFLRMESEGALGGQSTGYMQILLGGGYRLPLGPSTALKLYASAGPAGGGAVDMGGGVLIAAGLGLQQDLTRNTFVELSVGGAKSTQASFKALSVGLNLGYRFGLPDAGASTSGGAQLANYAPQNLRMRAVNQTYLKGSSNWRSRDEDMSVNNMGAQADYFLSPNWYLTGQGMAAYSGNAGSYMTGLVGVGGHLPLSDNWFIEAEALVGAAGGGTLNMGSGLVGQYNIGLGYQLTKALSLMVTGGQMAAANGDFRANVVGVSLGYKFNLFTEQ